MQGGAFYLVYQLHAGEFANKFDDVVNHDGYSIVSSEPQIDGYHEVIAQVKVNRGSDIRLLFIMKVKDIGRTKGCWKTACLKILD